MYWFGVATYQNMHGLTLELVTNNVHVLYYHKGNLIADYMVTMVIVKLVAVQVMARACSI